MKNKNLLRTMAACVVAVTMVLGMTACGSTDAGTTVKETTSSATSEETKATKSENTSAAESTSASASENTASAEATLSMDAYALDGLVTLGDYKNLTVSVAPVEVLDEDVQELMNNICLGYLTAENGITNRAVANGDTVSLNFAGYIDGAQFEGGTSEGYELVIGSHSFIDGFEEGLIGIMPGEERTLKLAFPDSYWNADYAGKPVDFVCTVNYIYPTEFSDEYVAGLGIDSVTDNETLKEYCYGYIYADNQAGYDEELEYALIMAAIEACPLTGEVPEDIVNYYGNSAKAYVENYAEYYGMDADSFTSYYYGLSVDEYASNYGKSVGQQYMVCQAIANAENLRVSDEELDTEMEKYAAENNCTVEDLLYSETKEDFRDYFMVLKVIAFLKENAKVEDAE